MSQVTSAADERAISLLGQGFKPIEVSGATGLSESRVSQLVSDPIYASQISALRIQTLTKHTEQDNEYDEIESTLTKRLKDSIGLMYDPVKISGVLSRVNAMKRRGASAVPTTDNVREVIPLILPISIVNQFTVNANNQVVKVGNQDLTTVQSSNMNKMLEDRKMKEKNYVLSSPTQELTTGT